MEKKERKARFRKHEVIICIQLLDRLYEMLEKYAAEQSNKSCFATSWSQYDPFIIKLRETLLTDLGKLHLKEIDE